MSLQHTALDDLWDVFRQPLVQALLSEGEEDVGMDMDVDMDGEKSIVMWLGPSAALAMLPDIIAKYERRKDLFTKM